MRFLWQVYWGVLPFPYPVDHVLSELSAMTCPSWVALLVMVHSFIELFNPLCHDKAVIHEGCLHKPLNEAKVEHERVSLKLKKKKKELISLASSPITSWQIEGGKVEVVTDFSILRL